MTSQIALSVSSTDRDDTVIVDWVTASAIGDSVMTWVAADDDRRWSGFSYSDEQNEVSISIVVSNVEDIDATLDSIDEGISNINSTHGTAFAPASEVHQTRGQSP